MEGGSAVSLDGATLKGARLAILKTSAFENLRDAPRAAFQSAVESLEAAGAAVEPIELECVSEAMGLAGVLFAPEAYGTWKAEIEANPDAMYPLIRERFRSGASISAADFVAAWQRLDALRAIYNAATSGFDAVILPTVPILPPKLAAVAADDDLFVAENLLTLQNTRIGNLMGLAGVTLPTGLPSCGILFQGSSEERLLRIGAAAEAALA